MPPAGFEPTISAGERPQTYALDRAATGIGISYLIMDTIQGDSGEHVSILEGDIIGHCKKKKFI